MVAFSGEVEFSAQDPNVEGLLGEKFTESNMNPGLEGRDLRKAFVMHQIRNNSAEQAMLGEGAAGPEGTLRKLVLRRLPFNLWYLHIGNEVWLLRLFHHRQDR